MAEPKNQTITDLFIASKKAYEENNWKQSERINLEIMSLVQIHAIVDDTSLKSVARKYLSSIVGINLYFHDVNLTLRSEFQKKVANLLELLGQFDTLEMLLEEIEQDIIELQLFINLPRADTLNKSARALRRIGRPDLAVELCNYQLSKTRLNYYSRITRSWALGDLGRLEEAIHDAEISLKFDPEKHNFSHIALSRAYRMRFRRDGDFNDADKSLEHAIAALEVKRNFEASVAFVAIAKIYKTTQYQEMIVALEKEFPKRISKADAVAVESALNIEQNSLVDEFFEQIGEDIEIFDEEIFEDWDKDEELPENYYEDYFSEYYDSLNDPRSPHLEP